MDSSTPEDVVIKQEGITSRNAGKSRAAEGAAPGAAAGKATDAQGAKGVSGPNGKAQDAASTEAKAKSEEGRNARKRRRGGQGSGRSAERRPRTFPTVKERLEIDHDIVKGAFTRNFEHFRTAFFHVTSVLGRFGLEAEAAKVHTYVIDMIESAESEIRSATAALAQQIEQAVGSPDVPRTSNNSEVREAEIPAFVVRRYVGLFKAADRLVDAIVYAETTGALSWQRRGEMLRDVPRYLRTPAGRFKSIASKLHERQKLAETSMEEAKTAMSETIQALLEAHMTLTPVESKRPLAKAAGKEG